MQGESVFVRYLNRPEDSEQCRDAQGWFRTGDVAVITAAGDYRILGRSSVDIIKVIE